jgi:hypothetical protein
MIVRPAVTYNATSEESTVWRRRKPADVPSAEKQTHQNKPTMTPPVPCLCLRKGAYCVRVAFLSTADLRRES